MQRIKWNWVLVWVLVLGVAGSLLWLSQQYGFAAFTPGLR